MLTDLLKKQPLFAIDLGTTKFCVARLSYNEKLNLEFKHVPAKGMRRGMLANFEEAAVALNTLVGKAEQDWGCDLQRVVTGIAGSHLRSEQVTCGLAVHGDVIASKHLESLLSKGEEAAQRQGEELLHLVPLRYRVDEREWLDTPLGFSGKVLTGRFLAIYCDATYARDVIRLINRAGVQVDEVYAEPFASATVSVSEQQRERGCVVADIGGGTTDGIVFQHGKPIALFTVNVAGNMMTNDLAIGLRSDRDSAERVKKRFGLNPQAAPMSIARLDGTEHEVEPKHVTTILSARIRDLGGLLVDALQPFKGALPAGLVLTGGGAQVIGIDDYLTKLLKIEVQKRLPKLPDENVGTGTVQSAELPYATVIGLLNLEISRMCEKKSKENHSWPARYIGRFVDWIKELS